MSNNLKMNIAQIMLVYVIFCFVLIPLISVTDSDESILWNMFSEVEVIKNATNILGGIIDYFENNMESDLNFQLKIKTFFRVFYQFFIDTDILKYLTVKAFAENIICGCFVNYMIKVQHFLEDKGYIFRRGSKCKTYCLPILSTFLGAVAAIFVIIVIGKYEEKFPDIYVYIAVIMIFINCIIEYILSKNIDGALVDIVSNIFTSISCAGIYCVIICFSYFNTKVCVIVSIVSLLIICIVDLILYLIHNIYSNFSVIKFFKLIIGISLNE